MPYIKKEDRAKFEQILSLIHEGDDGPSNAGELNYLITKICHSYLLNKSVKYDNVNEIIGALECVKQEFYRRVATPYEDVKIKENGDV